MGEMAYIPSSSRIIPLQVPPILDRPRLIECLKENSGKRVIFILGQAAQGKSTLAASWIKQSGIPSAWLNLDIDSSDPVNLFLMLIHSLQQTFEGVDFLDLMDYASISLGPREEIFLFREWSRAIFQRIAYPVQIVFDSLDRLSADAPSLRLLQAIIEDLPAHIHLILVSRTLPPLEVQRLKMSREIMMLSSEQLAFTAAETRAFFKELHQITLRNDQLQKIHKLTEGWVGGLILLSEAFKRLPQDVRAKLLLDGFFPDRFRNEVFEYMSEQIFSVQPEHVRDMLVKLSMFDVIDPSLTRDISGIENAEEVLNELERKNLFVQSLYYPNGIKVFRFHQLFKDFLLLRFRSGVKKGERLQWALKTGSLLEQCGELESTVRLYMKVKAYPEAARIIDEVGIELLKAGRTGELAQWLSCLPESMLRKDPWLLLYSCVMRRFTGARENIENLQKALAMFEERKDTRGRLLALAYLIEALVVGGYFTVSLSELLDRAETALQSLNSDSNRYEQATLWFQLGFGHGLCSGEPRKGLWACEKAYVMAKELRNIPLQINALTHIVMAYSALGEFSGAKEVCERVNVLLAKHPHSEFQSLHGIHESLIYTWSGDLKKAEEMIHAARQLVEEHGLVYLYPVALLYDLLLKPHLEQFTEAEMIGNRLLDFASSLGNLLLKGIASLYLAISYYHKGDYQRCLELLESSSQMLSLPVARADHHLSFIKLVKGLASNHLSHTEKDVEELRESIDHLTRISSFFLLAQSHLAMAFLTHKEGDPDEAAAHLEAGLKIADEKQYLHFSALSRKDAVRACILALELDVQGARSYVKRLLTTSLASLALPDLVRLTEHSDRGVRSRALDMMCSVRRSALPLVRIETLGGFRMLRGESPVEENQWGGKQPKLLLEMLITRGAVGVPKEVLLEDLWPEANPSTAESGFKVILHRLRRVLEPDMDNTCGSSYVHLGGGLMSLDRELCTLDTDQFLGLCKVASKKQVGGDLKGALSLYEQAEELYRGDFIAEELYVDEINRRREELRGKYIDMLCSMAKIHEQRGSFKRATACHKKVIQTDPLFEPAYQQLMMCFLNMGMKNEALRVYEECRKVLQAELGTEPDELTTAIHRKILEKT